MVSTARERKFTGAITRCHLERDEGIVYAARECRCHIDGEVWHLNIRGDVVETLRKFRLITVNSERLGTETRTIPWEVWLARVMTP
jgi:hypothetical protein